ncbi:YbaB/EbfC family nucleoid-associated protein [Streptomyces broussonetiae]|uniref:YbaB/EbfC family nucleoid-associated protein n=1 Tax=Streptomyces broussonetiae TaxID=2686304 RepID=UPI0035D72351
METSLGRRLEKVLADFAERHGILPKVQEQMRALSVTVRSRDGVVEVTLGADGRASGVRFVDRRYREMAAPQLADSVLEALTTAGAEVVAHATAVMMSTSFPLPVSAEPVPRVERIGPEAIREVQETPSMCWHRLVRESRAAVAGPARVRDCGAVKAGGTVGTWWPGTQEAGAGVRGGARPQLQGPLWGRSRLDTRPASSRTALPAELHEAVMALRDAVCGSCPPVGCGCPGALERPRKSTTTESA